MPKTRTIKFKTERAAEDAAVLITAKKFPAVRSFDEIMRNKKAQTAVKKSIAKELLSRKKPVGAQTYSSPYCYIYAEYLKGAKYERMTRIIENRLTDLGISGRIHRLSQFKNLEEIIKEDVKRGTSTVVIVGDDAMIKESLKIIAQTDAALGIIPIKNGDDRIAGLLGIPDGAAACDTLSRRIIENFDLGKINGKIFLSRLALLGQRMPIFCDNKYNILSIGGNIHVYNMDLERERKNFRANPKDGKFEVLVEPKKSFNFLGLGKKAKKEQSLLFAKKLQIKSSSAFSIFVDGKKNFYKDVDIEIMPRKLRVIVGRERLI